jgi:hypothetical protein
MAVGRISGPLLKANLLRNGVDLAFETDLLYLDVNNNRIGVKTTSPAYDVDVNGTINATNLRATNEVNVGNLNLQNNTISSNLGTIELTPAGNDPVIYHSKIHVDSLEFNDNYITTLDSNAPIELRPNGTGTIELVGNTNVTGNLFATGNITAAGNITLGDGNLDNININADVVSDIVPDVSDTFRLGLPTKRWKTIDANNANIGDLQITDNVIQPINTNEDLIIRANGTGVVNIYGLQVTSGGNVNLTGDELRFGNILVDGDADNTGIYATDSNTNININSSGTGLVLANGTNLLLQEGNVYHVTENGDDTNNGGDINEAFATLKHAISVATFGDTIRLGAGTFEEVAPLDLPQGITITGHGLRATQLKPTAATRTNDFFRMNGDCTVENLTVREIEWSGTTGYAFCYQPSASITRRSAYIKDVTVLNFGSSVRLGTNASDDPYGYDAGDAGRGILVDGSAIAPGSIEAAMLFDSVTLIVPNAKGIIITEGGRAEWLNSFIYFAQQGIEGLAGSTGTFGDGKTKIQLSGITGTFQAGDVVTFTSTDGSTVTNCTVESVSGSDTLIVDGRYDGLDGFDFTPDSISAAPSGATATSIVRYDRKDFGAEMRSIASANVYGQFGIRADGADVRLRMSSHDFGYIGAGKKFDNNDNDVAQGNEVTEVNGGRVFYNSTDQYGDYRIGDLFTVDQDTGAVTFSGGNFDVSSLTGITFTNGGDTTIVNPTQVSTGNLVLSGNTMSSTQGDINLTPFSGETNITGNLNVTGNIDLEGNITLGNQDTDNITINADLNSNLIPDADITYDIGKATKRWRNAHIRNFYGGDGATANLIMILEEDQVNATQIQVDNVLIRNQGIETTISGANLELQGNQTGYVDIVGTEALNIPVGTTIQRPTGVTGHIRFNSTTQQFEGYAVNAWSSLGGVRDVDSDTYIQPETAPGSDEDVLQFFTGGTETAQLDTTSFRTDVLQPLNADFIKFDNTTAIKLPVGTDGERPTGTANALRGTVRFNTDTTQFEGYNGTAWSSLGGVRDVDNDTYITPESAPGADEDRLDFYTAGIKAAELEAGTGLALDKIKVLDQTQDAYIEFDGTTGIKIPTGTTLQRPATFGPTDVGVIRYNSGLRAIEAWTGTSWALVGGGSLTDGDGDTFITVETANDDSDTFTFYVGSNSGVSPPEYPKATLSRAGFIVDGKISINENVIENINTNEDLILRASGTGRVLIDGGSSAASSSGNVFFTDPLISLNQNAVGANQVDMGMILERGSDINVGFVYDESEDEFAAIRSIEQGTQIGDITISGYENISANTVKIKGYTANRLTITDADKKIVTSDAGTTAYAEGLIDFDNGRLSVPKGTTAERAVSPVNGELRFNTDDEKFEAYYPTGGWNYLGIGYGTPVTHQAFTGDGSAYAFTLNKAPSSAEALMVAINGVVQTPGEAYVVAGNELIFIDSTSTAYPVENGAVIDVRHLSSPSVPATRVDTFTGDGSTQTFTLSVGAEDKYGVIVFVDNVYQDPEVYTVSGTTLTFPDGAPSNGDRINVLNYSSIPAPNVITRADAVDEAITYSIALG